MLDSRVSALDINVLPRANLRRYQITRYVRYLCADQSFVPLNQPGQYNFWQIGAQNNYIVCAGPENIILDFFYNIKIFYFLAKIIL